MMNTTTQKLTEWAINEIKTKYPQDVALLVAVKGHCVNGDGHGECFDYFVPATEKGNELAQTFIIDGIGHDLYPRSWERTESTANLDDTATLCLGNGKILYSRTKEDETHFYALQQKLSDNLLNKEHVYKKALEKLDIAMDIYRTMMFEELLYKVRMAAGFIAHYLSLAIAYLNGTYFKVWSDAQITELKTLKEIPDHFIEYYQAIIDAQTGEELKNLAHLIIGIFRRFVVKYKPERQPLQRNTNFSYLADWYQEMSLTWRRLRYYCDENNAAAAFSEACNLQNELMILKEEFGLNEIDLLSCFDKDNLLATKEQSSIAEEYIVSEIEKHGIKLNKYSTFEEFVGAVKK